MFFFSFIKKLKEKRKKVKTRKRKRKEKMTNVQQRKDDGSKGYGDNLVIRLGEGADSALLSKIVSRYFIKKHGWIGKSYRELCLTPDKLVTLNPSNMEVNSVTDFRDVVSVAPVPKSDEEFVITIRKPSGKLDKNTYSTNFRSYLLADLAQALSKLRPCKYTNITIYNILYV